MTSTTTIRTLRLGSGALLALVAACGAPESGRSSDPTAASGKADELDDAGEEADDLAHRDAVVTCEELASRILERTNLGRVEAIVKAERDR